MIRSIILGFVTGFLAVLLFHQGTAWLLHHYGNHIPSVVSIFGTVVPPYNMAPTQPFGVPTIFSQAFFGGLWGILLANILRNSTLPDLLFGLVFGALVLTLVAFTLVAYLKGAPFFANGNRATWWRAGLYNGMWGFGTALMLRHLGNRN